MDADTHSMQSKHRGARKDDEAFDLAIAAAVKMKVTSILSVPPQEKTGCQQRGLVKCELCLTSCRRAASKSLTFAGRTPTPLHA
eukprot:1161878-Pelagomonas_calceolata.AAC.3